MTEEKKAEEKPLHFLMPPNEQAVHYKLASWCMETKGSDRFHMVEAVQSLISDLDSCPDYPENKGEVKGCKSYSEKILKEALGKGFGKVMAKFNEEAAMAAWVKAYYDQQSRENINKEMIYDKDFVKFRKSLAQLSLIETTIPKIFCILLRATATHRRKVPGTYFGLEKRKPRTSSQKQQKSEGPPEGAAVTDFDTGEVSQT